jgi:hypothetical protein
MSELSVHERAELEALRVRVQQLERERDEQIAASNAALAAAQERLYWLDRWHLDLNALMERPGAAEFRALVRLVRKPVRLIRVAKRRLFG